MIINDDLKLKNKISDISKNIIIFDEESEAKDLIKTIEILIKERNYQNSNKELYVYYQEIIVKLRWVAFAISGDEEIINLFKNNFQTALDFSLEDYSLKEKMTKLLLGFDYQERDEIKAKVVQILSRNQALLTQDNLLNGQRPTVENWIKQYVSYIGNNQIDSLKFNQFFISSKDYINIDQNEKYKVKRFFEFFEKIKKSSFTIEGIEDTVPIDTPDFNGFLIDGKLVKNDPGKEKLELYEAVVAASKEFDAEKNKEQYFNKIDEKFFEKEITKPKPINKSPDPVISENGFSVRRPSGSVDSIQIKPRSPKIEEMKEMAARYPAGSLERKAVEEEIRKMVTGI